MVTGELLAAFRATAVQPIWSASRRGAGSVRQASAIFGLSGRWPTIVPDLRRRQIGRKPGRKRWQKSAAACRRLQVGETHETQKMPENPGFLEWRRVSQLGYGDLICKYLQNKALRQGTSRMAENCDRFSQASLATSACLPRILAGFWADA